MSSVRKLERISSTEYFTYEASILGKAEFYDGLIVDMAGSSPEHSNIAMNIGAELVMATRGKGCKVYNPDIHIAAANSYLHPDAAVVCGELEVSDIHKGVVRNPIVIVEVLSPSTSTRDRGEKFELYKVLDSLREYVLVEQDVPQIYVFTKAVGGDWVYHVYRGLDANLKLNSLGISIPLANIYYDVQFQDPASES